jgi:2-alkyl-3-oxoalkanoate reductase
MKIGIVGCGANAAYHINFARSYPGAEILGLVDRDKDRAEKCAARHGIDLTFGSIDKLVSYSRPDVLHIVTPPATHFPLASEAIEANCHVLIEKPMVLNGPEGDRLYHLAEKNGVKLCTMHNHFFDPCMLRARKLIQQGKAGRIIGVESHYGLNTRIDAFYKYSRPNVLPWIYELPGGVFHDFMAHPLYVLLPFIGEVKDVQVMGMSTGELPLDLTDELRLLLQGENALGTLTFSFAAKPHHHFLRLHGTRMMINVDFNTMTTTHYPVSSLPKAAQKATYNLGGSWQLFSGTMANVWNFGRKKLRPYQGMEVLIHGFYRAIEGKGEIPVSRKEALAVIEVMDSIWPRLERGKFNFDPVAQPARTGERSRPLVLITGGTGFVGRRLVEVIAGKGFAVRVLARKLSRIEAARQAGAEIYFGDVADISSMEAAFQGVQYVIHAAADTKGDEEEGRLSTIQGTRNILDLCSRNGVRQLIYISSCNVYEVAGYRKWQKVNENAALERNPEQRGAYTLAKLEAEKLVTSAMATSSFPIVCLRPGMIYGPGGEIFTPMMGFAVGARLFAVIGNGEFVLPLVYLDNLAEAVIAAMEKGAGGIYNVVDPTPVTKKDYMQRLVKRAHPRARTLYIPYSFIYFAVFMQEKVLQWLGKPPFLTRYRLASSQKPIIYDASKLKVDLEWQPPVPVQTAFARMIASRQELPEN